MKYKSKRINAAFYLFLAIQLLYTIMFLTLLVSELNKDTDRLVMFSGALLWSVVMSISTINVLFNELKKI